MYRPRTTEAAPTRDQRISMRVSSAERELLTIASRTADATLTDFILEAATARAEDVLADRHRFSLTSPEYADFVALLDRPVVQKPRLRKLPSEPTVFED